ncbi:MAG: protoheme farnesyltransferase [Hyphomicrobiales bacterium]|nr:protoheme farnesyltransferase [Hyphomicrobiales bacterium]
MSLVSPQDLYSGDAQLSCAHPKDYLALLKPRVMSLVVLTALAGILISPTPVHPVIGFASLLAIAVGAGASGALNMWYDADIDAVMKRTSTRPVPSGRVAPGEALAFGLVLSGLSVFTLGVLANWLAAGLLAFTIFFYAVIYTMWLKRSTPQNIVIGGAAGAFPPVVGYAAATGSVSLESLVLFAIIFIWTPPHFWALALVKCEDYAKAGVPMMPNALGPDRTRLEVLLYTIVLAPVGVLPWLMGFASPVYGALSVLGGALMLYFAWRCYIVREGEAARKACMSLFGFSILYLFVLFLEIAFENGPAQFLARAVRGLL